MLWNKIFLYIINLWCTIEIICTQDIFFFRQFNNKKKYYKVHSLRGKNCYSSNFYSFRRAPTFMIFGVLFYLFIIIITNICVYLCLWNWLRLFVVDSLLFYRFFFFFIKNITFVLKILLSIEVIIFLLVYFCQKFMVHIYLGHGKLWQNFTIGSPDPSPEFPILTICEYIQFNM